MPRAEAGLSSGLLANDALSRPASPPRAGASDDEPQRVAAAAEPEPQAEPEPEGILCFFEPENAEPELTPMELNFSDVTLYDGHTRSRQKGRLQITSAELSFFPAGGGGRAVSFPLESIEQSPNPPRAAGMGGRLKVEARVVVPRREQPAVEIAFEFGSRQPERDAALAAMSQQARKPD